MKFNLELDEQEIFKRFLIFQISRNKPQNDSNPTSEDYNSFTVENSQQLSEFTTRSPTLNLELPKIDTSGC